MRQHLILRRWVERGGDTRRQHTAKASAGKRGAEPERSMDHCAGHFWPQADHAPRADRLHHDQGVGQRHCARTREGARSFAAGGRDAAFGHLFLEHQVSVSQKRGPNFAGVSQRSNNSVPIIVGQVGADADRRVQMARGPTSIASASSTVSPTPHSASRCSASRQYSRASFSSPSTCARRRPVSPACQTAPTGRPLPICRGCVERSSGPRNPAPSVQIQQKVLPERLFFALSSWSAITSRKWGAGHQNLRQLGPRFKPCIKPRALTCQSRRHTTRPMCLSISGVRCLAISNACR